MATDKITDTLIKKNQPKKSPFKIKSVGIGPAKGLGLKIHKAGTVTWIFRYSLNGKEMNCNIGHYPQMSREQAEVEAMKCRSQVNAKTDPRVLRNLEGNLSIPTGEVFTVRHAVTLWLDRKPRAEHCRTSTGLLKVCTQDMPCVAAGGITRAGRTRKTPPFIIAHWLASSPCLVAVLLR